MLNLRTYRSHSASGVLARRGAPGTICCHSNKPFDDWFEELKSRLEQVPTEKQRAGFYARNPQLKPKDADKTATPASAKIDKQPSKPTPSADSDKKPTSEKPLETKQPPPPKPQDDEGKRKPSEPS